MRHSGKFYSSLQLVYNCSFFSFLNLLTLCAIQTSQQELLSLKTEPFVLDLYHKFEINQEFKLRGSILVRPKSEHRVAKATFVQPQNELTESDLKQLESEPDATYYLKSVLRKRKANINEDPLKVTQTVVKSCSLYMSNFVDYITVNLSPTNDFISLNLYTENPECGGAIPKDLERKFNTTIEVHAGTIGDQPDTTTYIKRLDEERQSKLKEGKEDNRSFLAKYWIYIVPAVVILMMMSGPEQGAR